MSHLLAASTDTLAGVTGLVAALAGLVVAVSGLLGVRGCKKSKKSKARRAASAARPRPPDPPGEQSWSGAKPSQPPPVPRQPASATQGSPWYVDLSTPVSNNWIGPSAPSVPRMPTEADGDPNRWWRNAEQVPMSHAAKTTSSGGRRG